MLLCCFYEAITISWDEQLIKDFVFRRALDWRARHKMKKLWKSNLAKKLKMTIVKVTIETILLYESETSTNRWKKRINGCYTKLLRLVLNVSCKDKWSNKKLYNDITKITNVIYIYIYTYLFNK